VFDVRPSDQSLFWVSVQIVEACALLGTVPNSKAMRNIVAAGFSLRFKSRNLKIAATFLKRKNPRTADNRLLNNRNNFESPS